MQTSYSQDPAVGLPGQLSNGRPSDVDTRITEGALVAPGLFVIASNDEGECKPPAAAWTAQTALGIVLLDPSREEAAYADKETCAVLRKGNVWVTFEPDATPAVDSPVFARHTANGAGKLTLGALRANADSANAAQVTGAYFRRISGTLAEVELNL